MKKYIIIAFLFTSTFGYAQLSQAKMQQDTVFGLNSDEFEYAKSQFIKMIHSRTYKISRKLSAEMEFKVNYNRIPMSSKEELTSWLTENLQATNFVSVEEGLKTIVPYIETYHQLLRENPLLYELLSKTTFEQFKEIMGPQFLLTAEDLKISE